MKRLHDLIRAVEKEAGKFSRVAASVTNLDWVNALIRWSVVCCRVVPVVIDAPLPNQ
jgi:hypothetical protein